MDVIIVSAGSLCAGEGGFLFYQMLKRRRRKSFMSVSPFGLLLLMGIPIGQTATLVIPEKYDVKNIITMKQNLKFMSLFQCV